MKDTYQSHPFQSTHSQKRIFGLPERHFYRVGVIVFYAVLFFMISFFSHRMHTPVNAIPETGESTMSR